MQIEEFRDIAARASALIMIEAAELDDVVGQPRIDGKPSGAEKCYQSGPIPVELLQQAGNPAARRFSFIRIVGAELAKEFRKAFAVVLLEPLDHGTTFVHDGTPAHVRNRKGLRSSSYSWSSFSTNVFANG